MPSLIQLFLGIIFLFTMSINTSGHSQASKQERQVSPEYITLTGQTIIRGNQIGSDKAIHSAMIHLMRSGSKSCRSTVLLLPGTTQEPSRGVNLENQMTRFLNNQGIDVAKLEYSSGIDSFLPSRVLSDAMKAFRLLRTCSGNYGLHFDRLSIVGILAGGPVAARIVQKLDEKEQPNNLILIDPLNFDETIPGTVFPLIVPPLWPTARLLCAFSANDQKKYLNFAREFTKTWKGYGGQASFVLMGDSLNIKASKTDLAESNPELAGLLKAFLEMKVEGAVSEVNPAAVPVAGYSPGRHAEKLALIGKEKFDLIMIGNSITNNFEKPEYQPVWNQFFSPRKAVNLGYSGYRTENLLWNIQNGELDGQSPRVIVLEIGTNNIDEKNYPTRHTAPQLAGGIEAIVKLILKKCPDSKVIVMRCFPGCYGGPNPTSHRAILERASDLVSRLADGKHVFYCDVNHVFLNMDGSINHEMMHDWLHPSPKGAKKWAQAMEPLLSELMGGKSHDDDIPANSAIVPASKLEEDSYNWWDRHAEVLHIKDSINPEVVLIGNSITHFWGGLPALKYKDGKPRNPNGPKAWVSAFGQYRVLNLGFGWDRTQNVLWRLDHGELDGIHPRSVIINIGTNNTSQTLNARMNSAAEIVDGICAICLRVRSKAPRTKIILMAVLPREQMPDNPRRILINEINRQMEVFAKKERITFVDIGPKMLSPDGTLSKEIAGDFCHPTEKGYQIWADVIRSLIDEP